MPHLLNAFAAQLRRRKAARDLSGLPDYLLKDLGISRAEIISAVRGGIVRNPH